MRAPQGLFGNIEIAILWTIEEYCKKIGEPPKVIAIKGVFSTFLGLGMNVKAKQYGYWSSTTNLRHPAGMKSGDSYLPHQFTDQN